MTAANLHRETRRSGTGGRLAALALTLAVAACGDGAVPVSPLPVQHPSVVPTPAPPVPSAPSTPPSSAGTPTVAPTPRHPARSTPAVRTPPATGSPSASPSGLPDSCLGAVRYDLVLAENELALITSLCFATGAVLRIIGIGPGEVTADPEELVSRSYAGGRVDVRFVRPGTVTVLIPQQGTTYPITVVVR